MQTFHVQVTRHTTEEYVVRANSREDAEDAVAVAQDKHTPKYSPANLIHVRSDSSCTFSISDAENAAWTEALKRKKRK